MLTLSSMLDRTLRLFAPRTAVIDPESTFNWAQFGEPVAYAASLLKSQRPGRGERYASASDLGKSPRGR